MKFVDDDDDDDDDDLCMAQESQKRHNDAGWCSPVFEKMSFQPLPKRPLRDYCGL